MKKDHVTELIREHYGPYSTFFPDGYVPPPELPSFDGAINYLLGRVDELERKLTIAQKILEEVYHNLPGEEQ